MISHQHKCIYIHIPKVAGTSITETLKDPEYEESEGIVNTINFIRDKNPFAPPPSHLRPLDYLKYNNISQADFDNYFKFSFVRNPWARIVSEYKYRNHAWKYSFKEFLFKHFPEPSWSDEYCHIIPQYYFLFDENGNQLVDFIGKMENIKNDFAKVCRHLNIAERPLIKSNVSQSVLKLRGDAGFCEKLKRIRGKFSIKQRQNTFNHYTEYYDRESQEFVADLYKKDIETFDYQFNK